MTNTLNYYKMHQVVSGLTNPMSTYVFTGDAAAPTSLLNETDDADNYFLSDDKDLFNYIADVDVPADIRTKMDG